MSSSFLETLSVAQSRVTIYVNSMNKVRTNVASANTYKLCKKHSGMGFGYRRRHVGTVSDEIACSLASSTQRNFVKRFLDLVVGGKVDSRHIGGRGEQRIKNLNWITQKF